MSFLEGRSFTALSLSDAIRQELAARGLEESRERMIEVGQEMRRKAGPGALAQSLATASPLNLLRIDALGLVFGGAPILGLQRDPRDAVLDGFLADFDGSEWSAPLADLAASAELYARLHDLWVRARARMPRLLRSRMSSRS